jgi:hypothetical protein
LSGPVLDLRRSDVRHISGGSESLKDTYWINLDAPKTVYPEAAAIRAGTPSCKFVALSLVAGPGVPAKSL